MKRGDKVGHLDKNTMEFIPMKQDDPSLSQNLVDEDDSVNEQGEAGRERRAIPAAAIPKDSSESAALPLCPVHQSLEDSGNLEVEYGNRCIACSLNERVELRELLVKLEPPEGRMDAVSFLREVITQYKAMQNLCRMAFQQFEFQIGKRARGWDLAFLMEKLEKPSINKVAPPETLSAEKSLAPKTESSSTSSVLTNEPGISVDKTDWNKYEACELLESSATPLVREGEADQPCLLGEPMMHGPQPYRWCATHNRLLLSCEASKAVQPETGLNEIGLSLFRQLVRGKNSLRILDVFPCNQAEHNEDCECFWEQCERWADSEERR
jgi:hypothetical protein